MLDYDEIRLFFIASFTVHFYFLAATGRGFYSIMETDLQKLSKKNLGTAVLGLKAIAHPCRLQILCSLSGSEMTVGDMVRQLGLSQSAVSQHLSRMKAAGILKDRRAGNQVYYSLKEKDFEVLLGALCKIYVK